MGPPWLAAGAGQDVGRSCILVSIAGKNVMLDCGMHMGYNDDVSKQPSVHQLFLTPLLVSGIVIALRFQNSYR